MDALPWLILVLTPVLIAAYDPSISNGTCYYGANKAAANNFIPCGNSAGGVQSCCQARDICLSSNACFNGQYFVTYLAGCTDENYESSKCPDKAQFSNQQWVGLVRCFVSNTTGEEWGPCQETTQPKVNQGNQQCTCDSSSSTAVFTDSAVLTNIASLPVSVGNAIAWESGFEPSTTIIDSTTTMSGSTVTSALTTKSASPSPGTSANAASTAGPTIFPDPSPSPVLSTAAKAGIGIGAVAGLAGIVAILLMFIWYQRRKRKTVPPIQDQIRPSSIGPWSMEGRTPTEKHEPPGGHHKSWGAKSELPTEANEVTTTRTTLGEGTIRTTINTPNAYPTHHSPTTEASEVDGSPAASTSRLTQSNTAYGKPAHSGPIYEMEA